MHQMTKECVAIDCRIDTVPSRTQRHRSRHLGIAGIADNGELVASVCGTKTMPAFTPASSSHRHRHGHHGQQRNVRQTPALCSQNSRFGGSLAGPRLGEPFRVGFSTSWEMDVVFSAAAKHGRLAPLTQIVPHCGESEGGPHEGRASSTKSGGR